MRHPGPCGSRRTLDPAGSGQEAVGGILGVQAALDGMTALCQLGLGERQGLAAGNAQLLVHKVDAADLLCDGVLDLQPGVHFEEIEPAVRRQQELHRAGAGVVHGVRQAQGGIRHALPQIGVYGRRGRLLDDLLMPALDRALALEQVNPVAAAVAEHLHLYVSGPVDIFFKQQGGVPKGLLRLARPGLERREKFRGVLDHPHAFAAAAGSRLHQHGVTEALRGCRRLTRQTVGVGCLEAGNDGHAGPFGDLLGNDLRAHVTDRG